MLGEIRDSDIARFWAKVDPSPTPTGCLLWTAATINDRGYGAMRWKFDRMTMATHIAWEIQHGIPPTLEMLHGCDNPPCVNVTHLVDDKHAQNLLDAYTRGLVARGVERAQSKLTDEIVIDLRRRYRSGGVTFNTLATDLPVDPFTVRRAVRGLTWRHVTAESPVPTTKAM